MVEHGYEGAHVELYDEQVGDRGDVSLYVDLARDAAGPALEVACGTGRIYLEQLAAGVDADGFDASADALTALRETATERGLEPSVWQGDMAAFEVDRAYALAYCPFNAVQHLRSVDDQLAALECVHDALAPGGRFVFDTFVPSFELIEERYGEWSTRTVRYRGEEHEYRTRTRIVDEVHQAMLVENELYAPDGSQVSVTEHRLAMLPYPHVELLARLSPFDAWSVAGGFDDSTAGDAGADDTIHHGDSVQVWTLARTADPECE